MKLIKKALDHGIDVALVDKRGITRPDFRVFPARKPSETTFPVRISSQSILARRR